MAFNTSEIDVVGIVLDISQRHSSNGSKNIDNVKSSLVDFLRKNFDDDDIMYLYHPDIIEPSNRVGAQVATISNYRTDGWKFDLGYALKQTLFIISAESYESKSLLLITDRLDDPAILKKISSLNKKDMLGCNLICVDVGCHLPDVDFAKIVHVPDSSQLVDSFKEIVYGKNDIRCTNSDTK